MNNHVLTEAWTCGHRGARCSAPAHDAYERVQKIRLPAGGAMASRTTASGVTSLKTDPEYPALNGNGEAYE